MFPQLTDLEIEFTIESSKRISTIKLISVAGITISSPDIEWDT